jgi:hypothetical protein
MQSNVIPPVRPDGMPAILKAMKPFVSKTFPIERRNAAWMAANRLGIPIITRRNKSGTKFTLWRVS